MSPSEWNEDEQDPLAPLPAHERQWRHPSEFGQQQWQGTEPALTIGRGLTAATGAIGGMLAIAVLWTMLPTQAGRSAGSSVRSTLATRTTAGFGADLLAGSAASSLPANPATTTSADFEAVGGTRPDATLTDTVASAVLPPRPMATYSVVKTDESTTGAIAVAVNGGSLVITTANAVSADLTVELMLPDGTSATARVLFVDTRSGLAVLAPETVSEAASFTVGTSILPGDELTFMGDRPNTVTVDEGLTIDANWSDTPHAEGTPVVNQRGELVALCTHDANNEEKLVPLANLDELQQAIAADSAGSKVWLGVILNDDPAGDVTVGAVDPAGPAADAGISVGDILVSIDGTAITARSVLASALSDHEVGDVVLLSVQRLDGGLATLSITLGAPRQTL